MLMRAPTREGNFTKELAIFPRIPITAAMAKTAATAVQTRANLLTRSAHPLDHIPGLIGVLYEAFDVEGRFGVVHHVPIGVVDVLEILHRNCEVLLLEVVLGVEVEPDEVVL